QLSNSITVIDGATNLTADVLGGHSPYSLAVNPVTNRIYVGNGDGYTVTVIDGATNAVSEIVSGFKPSYLAVNTVTDKVYAANVSGDITVIDGQAGTSMQVS